MKNPLNYLLCLLLLASTGCATRSSPRELYGRIESMTNYLKDSPGAAPDSYLDIWYIGSDNDRHYFGEYHPSVLHLIGNDIDYVYVLRSEISIVPEKTLTHRLGSGTNAKDGNQKDWFVPTSLKLIKDKFPKSMVLATFNEAMPKGD